MPAVSAMIDVVAATADLGLAATSAAARVPAARRARVAARRLLRRGKSSFYAATALRLWAQAEALGGDADAARALLARGQVVAAAQGGKVDQLAIAALDGQPIDPGALAAAIGWSTGGVIQLG
jgi:hypothetical protein